jgi:DNA-binding transcriptional LysR family regulator
VLHHQCIRFRHRGESVYKWEFDKGDESLAIAVNGALLLDELDLVIQAALDGAGLAWIAEDRVAEHLASGALVRVLEDWCRRSPLFSLLPNAEAATRRAHGPYHDAPDRR